LRAATGCGLGNSVTRFRAIAGRNSSCSFFGGKSLLTHTRERISPLFAEDNTLFVLNGAHEAYYGRQLSAVSSSRKLVQPSNRGTAAAIVLSVLEILQRDIDATIAFFPSDHHYLEPSIFRESIGHGLRLANRCPDRVLILGAPANYPEVEYGWIQPGGTVVDSVMNPLQFVSAFWEKPSLTKACSLQQSGCLWNTFVTIGTAGAFVELFAATAPRLLHVIGKDFSRAGLDQAYDDIECVDFSRDILSAAPHRLLVLRDGPSGWTDFGSPRRAMDVLQSLAAETALKESGQQSLLQSALLG
jgi:mannose-1-phosphate guanylyltransferase